MGHEAGRCAEPAGGDQAAGDEGVGKLKEIIEIIIAIGGVWTGFVAIRGFGRLFKVDNSAIELIEVECRYYHNDRRDNKAITGVHLSAMLTNSGTNETSVSVQSVESSLGGKRADPAPVSWPVLPVGPGVPIELAADNITRRIRQGEYVQGRIDWVIAVGVASKKQKKREFRIKGEIGVDNTRAKGQRFLWRPDPDSEHPIGMNAAGTDATGPTPYLKRISRALDE